MEPKPFVLIVGAGEIGSCLAKLMERNAVASLWDIDEKKRSGPESLETVASRAQIVFVCVPSRFLGQALASLTPTLPAAVPVVCLTKGMDQDGRTPHEIAEDAIKNPVAVLAGPMVAEILNQNLPGYAVVASHDQDVFPVIRKLFTNTRLVLKEEPDIKHTCYCSVLKNVYALLVGMNDGYGCGDNARGMLVAKCLQEMDESAKVLAVPRRVITGPAGWGDFFGTALSEHSLNRAVGERLARGETVLHAEGLDSLVGLVKLLVSRGAHPLPLLAFLESAARGTASREQFEILLSM